MKKTKKVASRRKNPGQASPPRDPFVVEIPDRVAIIVQDDALIRRNAELLTQAVLTRPVRQAS